MRRLSGVLLTILVTLPVVLLLSTCGPPAMAANAPTYGEVHCPPENDSPVCPSPYEPFRHSRPNTSECNTLNLEKSLMNWDFDNRRTPPKDWFENLQVHETLQERDDLPRIFTFRLAGPERYDQRSIWIAVWIQSNEDGTERYLANSIEDQTLRDLRSNKLELRLVIAQDYTTVIDLNPTEEGVEFVCATFYPYKELDIDHLVTMEFLDPDILPPRLVGDINHSFHHIGLRISELLHEHHMMKSDREGLRTPLTEAETQWWDRTQGSLVSLQQYIPKCQDLLYGQTENTPT